MIQSKSDCVLLGCYLMVGLKEPILCKFFESKFQGSIECTYISPRDANTYHLAICANYTIHSLKILIKIKKTKIIKCIRSKL